jgi:hypothetical protein
MTHWFRQHRYALAAALVHLRRSPGGFLFNILVVAIALALPFMGVTLLDNVRPMSESAVGRSGNQRLPETGHAARAGRRAGRRCARR